jgi:hypothetical protein
MMSMGKKHEEYVLRGGGHSRAQVEKLTDVTVGTIATDIPIDDLLRRLHLANARRFWRDLCQRAEREQWSYEDFLATLVADEVAVDLDRRGAGASDESIRSLRLSAARNSAITPNCDIFQTIPQVVIISRVRRVASWYDSSATVYSPLRRAFSARSEREVAVRSLSPISRLSSSPLR